MKRKVKTVYLTQAEIDVLIVTLQFRIDDTGDNYTAEQCQNAIDALREAK